MSKEKKITAKQFKELVELEIENRKQNNKALDRQHREYIASLLKDNPSVLSFDGRELSAYHSITPNTMTISGVVITCQKTIREIEKSAKYRASTWRSYDRSNVSRSLRFKLGMQEPNSDVASEAIKQKMQELLDVIYERDTKIQD